MNTFVFYLVLFGYSFLSTVYGMKLPSDNSYFNPKPTSYKDYSTDKLQYILDIFSEKNNPAETKHLFKLNVDAPNKLQPNFGSDKNTVYRRPDTPFNKKSKTLSTQVKSHIIKVTSALQSNNLGFKQPKEGGSDISVNPQYSHVIEILPIEKKAFKKENELKNLEASEGVDQNHGAREVIETESGPFASEAIETESGPFASEAIETESGPFASEAIETETGPFAEEVIETGPFGEEEIETESVPFIEEIETESGPFAEEIETESGPFVEESIQTESIVNSPVTGVELLSGSNKESAFNDELEGSGEGFFRPQDDQNSKSGRIFGVFPRQNATAPNCTTPKGESGHCRRIRDCLLNNALNNFNVFLQHLCLIRGALVGVCCPDNPVNEIFDPDDNTTNSFNETDIKQPPEGCGLNVKSRIVGGTVSVPHEWTWMVALLRRNRFFCGGVLINNWYVLTAAHCVLGMNVKDLTVRLGEYDFNTHNKHQEDISVSEIKWHAKFVTLTFQHDVALVKLKQSVQYSKFVGSICLPEEKTRDYSDVKGTVVGWGTVSFGGAASPILRQVSVPIWKNKDCDRTYTLETINDAFMCAGSPEKGEDACQGDSGGPLMAVNEKGRWEVIGLVSWGRRCGDPTYPGVYTRVTTYLDWINTNMI